MQDEKLTLDKAINEAKSSELIKQHFEILKGDSEDEKIDRIQNDRRVNRSRENNKILDKEISVIDVANHQHTREKIGRLSMRHAWSAENKVIMPWYVKAKKFGISRRNFEPIRRLFSWDNRKRRK